MARRDPEDTDFFHRPLVPRQRAFARGAEDAESFSASGGMTSKSRKRVISGWKLIDKAGGVFILLQFRPSLYNKCMATPQ